MILFSLVASLMHKSGLLLAMIVVIATILNKLLKTSSHKSKVLINFLIAIFLLIITYSLKFLTLPVDHQPSRIIGGDYRGAFVFISLIYAAFSFFYRSFLANSFNLTLYYFSFISLAFLMNGLNWEYERLGMMMIIPYILSFGVALNGSSYKIYLILTFLLLFWLTIYNDIYFVGLK